MMKTRKLRAPLQWSRRVNTAECEYGASYARRWLRTSMEPPCEHGGVALAYTAADNRHFHFNGAAV